MDAEKLEKPLPEVGCEDWITIADKAGRQTVKSDDVLEEKGCHVRGRHSSWREVDLLSSRAKRWTRVWKG